MFSLVRKCWGTNAGTRVIRVMSWDNPLTIVIKKAPGQNRSGAFFMPPEREYLGRGRILESSIIGTLKIDEILPYNSVGDLND